MDDTREPPSRERIGSFEQTLRKTDEPDFTIHLQHFTWRVHADVLTEHSDFFRNLCKVNSWKESEERAITLHDDNPFSFARFLQFAYYGSYHQCHSDQELQWSDRRIPSVEDLLISGSGHNSYQEEKRQDEIKKPLSIDLEVYDLADKYGMSSLKVRALDNCGWSYGRNHNLLATFSRYYPDRMNQDPELKKRIADCIFVTIDQIRGNEAEWENGAGKWMKEDFELCTMVIDKLRVRDHRFY